MCRWWFIMLVIGGKKFKNFLIAEAGINHNGDIKTALKLIDSAKKNGADAIKFQTYKTEKRINKKYTKIFKILKRCELNFKEFKILKDYCDKKKIIFFSTPFDCESAYFLDDLGVKLFKIASFDISNLELINCVLGFKKSTIISTGMSNLKEIENIFKIYKKRSIKLYILHCISSYPNKEHNSLLSNIEFLKKKFNCNIGLSDHTNGIKIPIYANLLGANIIEKHFKLNKDHKCVDSSVSITGDQLKKLAKEINNIDKILGQPKFGIRTSEKGSIIFKRKKIIR